jgi:hypothetical protein
MSDQFRRRETLALLTQQLDAIERNGFVPRNLVDLGKTIRSLLTDYDNRLTRIENEKAPAL